MQQTKGTGKDAEIVDQIQSKLDAPSDEDKERQEIQAGLVNDVSKAIDQAIMNKEVERPSRRASTRPTRQRPKTKPRPTRRQRNSSRAA